MGLDGTNKAAEEKHKGTDTEVRGHRAHVHASSVEQRYQGLVSVKPSYLNASFPELVIVSSVNVCY